MNYVLITGAYGGLGTALAEQFSQKGYGIIVLGRNPEKLHLLQQHLTDHADVISIPCDVSDWQSCQNAYDLIKASSINLKVLINNAGISYIQNFNDDYRIEKYQELIATNLNGTVYLTKLFLNDLLQNNGSIINISSVLGYAPVIGRTAYAASKFGMEGFFAVLQAELTDKIHILMAYPTFIATGIRDKIEGKHEVNEILTPEQVAQEIFNGFQAKKQKIYIGKTAKLSYLMFKFLPKMYVNLMRKKVNHD